MIQRLLKVESGAQSEVIYVLSYTNTSFFTYAIVKELKTCLAVFNR
jgi:hypothetical protein